MNELILAHAGRKDGDQPRSVKPSGMSKVLLEAMPKDNKNIFIKKDE